MPFQVQPVKEFLVSPALPPAISRLGELAHNLLWSWDHTIRPLFRRLDPSLWKECHRNPVLMLGRIPQESLEKAAADPRYIALYQSACRRYDEYMSRPADSSRKDTMLVAYFSMEYGLLESLTIYSGGLGILSGDHLKAASDAGLNLVGIGLLYQKGYLQQYLNPDGWQTEKTPVNDFYTWPVQPALDANGNEILVELKLPHGMCSIKVWRMKVGRVDLLLLDTNIPQNQNPEYRDITDQLYGGDNVTRIQQELVLGVGGLRALKALGLEPTVYHMNEGHSAFLALERIRLSMQEHRLSFEEALESARGNNVFTTHTPVPAGIDMFDPGLVYEYLHGYCERYGVPFDKFLSLGQGGTDEQGDRFSMAVLALKTSAYRNAVSRLHGEISQEMFHKLWPDLPIHEVPITPITNGVHLPTWLNGDLALLYDQYLAPDWRERYPEGSIWEQVPEIPNDELWEIRRRRKRRLINFVRERMSKRAQERRASSTEQRRLAEMFDPEAFTIGFSRRFATYKRATLIFRDKERLKKILSNPQMPVQILVAGKAHPKDNPGKQFIREIVQLSRDPGFAKHVVFIEDYDIEVARELVHGVDLWLNNPRRGEEACGTSGMKAAINGTLNLSILDGWFDEAYEVSGGWAIGDRDLYSPDMDDLHASSIYSQLENDILPLFYKGREEGVPHGWMQRVKQSLMNLSPGFNCQRMIHDYTTRFYEPAHIGYLAVRRDDFQPAREKASWYAQVERLWSQVSIQDSGDGPGACVLTGTPIQLRAAVRLAGLTPEDVRVEAVVGRVNPDGGLEDTSVITLPPLSEQSDAVLFGRDFVPHQTGRLGYTLRVSPNHCDDPLTRPCLSPVKWTRS
ncbi:alpha-glucan family phosphorylase [Paludibaculum fermentans]|uniref:alpha-glucan family phosphorylase n=1 Tax=Paludibaculum fermentans TaxID=1473598 RepID=UPI003EC089E0